MIKSVLKLGVLLLIGILGYNYFLGNPEEKAKSKEIIGKTVDFGKDIGKAGVGLIKEEYQKFKNGKYDKALDKVGNLLKDAKQKGGEIVNDIQDWEERRKVWKEKKDAFMEGLEDDGKNMTDAEKEKMKELEREGKALEKDGKDLKDKADKQ